MVLDEPNFSSAAIERVKSAPESKVLMAKVAGEAGEYPVLVAKLLSPFRPQSMPDLYSLFKVTSITLASINTWAEEYFSTSAKYFTTS